MVRNLGKQFRSAASSPEFDDNGRIIRYVFSDDSVARDNHTINTNGWDLVNFLRNPVFLWVHDSSDMPIGRVVDIGVSNKRLMGNVEYIERDLSPFADTVYQLVRKGFLNATSVSWNPLEWKFSQDKGRTGGIDFIRQELLEVSQVPVPALPTALVTARAQGIDTQPMVAWLERALDTGGLQMVPRQELNELRRAAKMPTRSNPKNRVALGAKKRGLYTVSYLADLVCMLGYLTSSSQEEEIREGDDSDVPGMLLDTLKSLGAALVAMTIEEVSELVTTVGGDELDDAGDVMLEEAYVAAANTPAQRLLRGLAVQARRSAAPGDNIKLVERFIRAGRVLSADNEKTLRAAADAITEAVKEITEICDAAGGSSDDDEDKARRLRVAQARARAVKILTGVAGE